MFNCVGIPEIQKRLKTNPSLKLQSLEEFCENWELALSSQLLDAIKDVKHTDEAHRKKKKSKKKEEKKKTPLGLSASAVGSTSLSAPPKDNRAHTAWLPLSEPPAEGIWKNKRANP